MDRKNRKRVIGRGSLYFFKRSMYLGVGKNRFFDVLYGFNNKNRSSSELGWKKKTSVLVCVYTWIFNATFNNIPVISLQSVLLVEETGVPGENHRPVATDRLHHIMLYSLPWSRFALTTSVVIGTDCIGSCKSNYHTITSTTVTYVNIQQVPGQILNQMRK